MIFHNRPLLTDILWRLVRCVFNFPFVQRDMTRGFVWKGHSAKWIIVCLFQLKTFLKMAHWLDFIVGWLWYWQVFLIIPLIVFVPINIQLFFFSAFFNSGSLFFFSFFWGGGFFLLFFFYSNSLFLVLSKLCVLDLLINNNNNKNPLRRCEYLAR